MPARPARTPSRRFDASGLTVLLVAALVLCCLTASAPPGRVHATGAVGVVVRHGDGRVLYAYIPLTGDQITGAEALMRAGLPLNVQASSSLGTAVCTIDGEGCNAPQEDCFCKSYGDPSFYWHYYFHRPNGAWSNANLGAGNRILHDGDIDGWSWTASDSGLPSVTLEQIAALVQVPTTVAPPPLPPPAVQPGATSGIAPIPAATAPPLAATATASPTTAPPQTAPAPLSPSPAGTVSATMPPDPPATIAATAPLSPTPSSLPPASPTAGDTQPRAVVVGPNGTVTPVQAAPPPSGNTGGRTFAIFAAVAVGMLVLLAVVPRGARWRRQRGDGGRQ